MVLEGNKGFNEIIPNKPWWKHDWAAIWRYKHLFYFLVKRDVILQYKQTILGPLHLIIRPFVTTLLFQIIFHRMGGLSTNGIPPFLFYFANTTLWSLFSGVFNSVSGVFTSGKTLMCRVYFPRLIPPLASALTNSISFLIQFSFLLIIACVMGIQNGSFSLKSYFLLCVVPVFQMGLIAVGAGFLFACVTLKYRDLNSLSNVVVQGLMFLSPVIYPFASIAERYVPLASLNPISGGMELYRYFLFGQATLSVEMLISSWLGTFILLFFGFFTFNVIQRKFVDIV